MTSSRPASVLPSASEPPSAPAPPDAAPPPAGRGPGAWARRIRRGHPEDPRWARPALLALLLGTGLLYLWNLGASGYANSYYSAAAQAGGESWKAFFFGSFDAANAITVDKPPGALWPMALSVRLFGLGSWQILLPEVLMGVATVGVLYAAVRRRSGPGAGLLAGGVLALTPVAALMFRFNNPDALLALLTTAAVYCVLRALERARTAWLVAAGAAVGLAFLTKTLQAFLVLPPLALVYAVCAPTTVRRRLGQLALSGAALVASCGWWVAVVELWPADSRPYVGGSQENSFLELTFGYNGLGRLNGDEPGSVGPPAGEGFPGGGVLGGATGLGRMFGDNVGGQISWLLPAALILLAAALVLTRRQKRTDPGRAAFLAWGGVLLVTAAVFSFMAGIFHEYYTVALAPAVAALTGMGGALLWERRRTVAASAVLGGTVAVTAVWAYVLLGRSEDWLPWLRWTVLAAGLAAAAGLLLAGRLAPRLVPAVAGLGLAASLAGPFAYTLNTVDTGHTGAIVTAGPRTGGGTGLPGGAGFPGGSRGTGPYGLPGGGTPGGNGLPQLPDNMQLPDNVQIPNGTRLPDNMQLPDGMQPPGGGGQQPGGPGGLPDGARGTSPGQGQGGQQPGQGRQGGGTGGPGGGTGGLLDGPQVGDELAAHLTENAGRSTWVVATVGSQNAASYQLATEKPVMAVGGFNGSDPSPTLAQFKEYVERGEIRYFVPGRGLFGGETGGGLPGFPGGGETDGGGFPGGLPGTGGGDTRSQGSEITSWVQENFTRVTVDGTTLYDLARPKG